MHVARVSSVDRVRCEARVTMGGISCRVCGGQGCALKDRVLRVALPEELARSLDPGEVLQVDVAGGALLRAAISLLVFPLAAAALAWAATATAALSVAAGCAAVGALLWRGSTHRDLPRGRRATTATTATTASATTATTASATTATTATTTSAAAVSPDAGSPL